MLWLSQPLFCDHRELRLCLTLQQFCLLLTLEDGEWLRRRGICFYFCCSPNSLSAFPSWIIQWIVKSIQSTSVWQMVTLDRVPHRHPSKKKEKKRGSLVLLFSFVHNESVSHNVCVYICAYNFPLLLEWTAATGRP